MAIWISDPLAISPQVRLLKVFHILEGISTSEKYESALVISDTHVGLPDEEIFGQEFESFIKYLSSTKEIQVDGEAFQFERPKAIVLLGDFLDLWDGRLETLPGFSANFARPLTEFADVFYLRGNHDYIIPNIEPAESNPRKFEICENKCLEVGGRQFFFIHGHQFMSAFGPASLKIESFINPFYTTMESFASRLTGGHGRELLEILAIIEVVLALVLAKGQSLLADLPSVSSTIFWLLFGLLFPIGFSSIWRLAQKSVWKFISLIFGEVMNFVRGAVRGDTIEYLTSPSKPIFRWFEKSDDTNEARNIGFVVFGHTHIPEGPMPGSAKELGQITFLNTGSWMKPPSVSKSEMSQMARRFTRPIDRFDEYAVLIVLVLNVLASFWLQIPLLAVLIIDAILLLTEIFLAIGKSSYRRLPQIGLRSLAFIGLDSVGVLRETLLYWNPTTGKLSTIPPVQL